MQIVNKFAELIEAFDRCNVIVRYSRPLKAGGDLEYNWCYTIVAANVRWSQFQVEVYRKLKHCGDNSSVFFDVF